MNRTADTHHPIHSLLVGRWSPYAFADRDQPRTTVRSGGYFLREGRGEELARIVAEFVKSIS